MLQDKVKQSDVQTNADTKDRERDRASGRGGGGGTGSGGSTGEGDAQRLEVQGIPYMCLAQCEDMDTVVGHRKVPPMKASCISITVIRVQTAGFY